MGEPTRIQMWNVDDDYMHIDVNVRIGTTPNMTIENVGGKKKKKGEGD